MDKDMDDFETASLEGGPVPLYPLYSVNPQPNSRTDNLSCSKNDQFCYLCQYTQETGLATDIRDHIRVLARRGYELTRIVAAVSRIYKNELQAHTVHVTQNGNEVNSPVWSKDSITTHLLMSTEFQDTIFYKNYIGNVFQHMIKRQVDRTLREDGSIDESARKNLLESIFAMGRWRGLSTIPESSSDVQRAGKKTKH